MGMRWVLGLQSRNGGLQRVLVNSVSLVHLESSIESKQEKLAWEMFAWEILA
jgi:hypothetical protein